MFRNFTVMSWELRTLLCEFAVVRVGKIAEFLLLLERKRGLFRLNVSWMWISYTFFCTLWFIFFISLEYSCADFFRKRSQVALWCIYGMSSGLFWQWQCVHPENNKFINFSSLKWVYLINTATSHPPGKFSILKLSQRVGFDDVLRVARSTDEITLSCQPKQ